MLNILTSIFTKVAVITYIMSLTREWVSPTNQIKLYLKIYTAITLDDSICFEAKYK